MNAQIDTVRAAHTVITVAGRRAEMRMKDGRLVAVAYQRQRGWQAQRMDDPHAGRYPARPTATKAFEAMLDVEGARLGRSALERMLARHLF